MLFDTHVHFDGLAQEEDPAQVLARAAAAGVERMLAVGGSVEANSFALRCAGRFPDRVSAAVGFDRDQAAAPPAEPLPAGLDHAVAVGETGLDFHHLPEQAEAQQKLFRAMLAVAREHGLPVIVHSREADEATLALLREHAAAWQGDHDRIGVLHCFTGGPEFARKLLDLGLYLSFSGILTFKKSAALRDVARSVPADRLLIETDAPLLAPVPHRGRRNEPAYVRHVAEVLAEVRGTSMETLAHDTSANARRLFDPAP